MSNDKFLIRTAAFKLLEKIYLESDSYLKATINVTEIVTDKFDKLTYQKACQYLIKKHLVESNETVTDKWTATITYSGIDWIEDNYKEHKEWLI